MFEDRVLERHLRRTVRGGLTIYRSGSAVTFLARNWVAGTTMEALSDRLRGSLGAMVEFLGYLPEEGGVMVQLQKGVYSAQEVLPEVVAESLGSFIGNPVNELRPTPISYGAQRLLQAEDRRVVAVSGPAPDASGRLWETVAHSVMIRDEDSRDVTYVTSYIPGDDSAEGIRKAWKYLEQRMWADWEEQRWA